MINAVCPNCPTGHLPLPRPPRASSSLRRSNTEVSPVNNPTVPSKHSSNRKSCTFLTLNQKLEGTELSDKGVSKAQMGQNNLPGFPVMLALCSGLGPTASSRCWRVVTKAREGPRSPVRVREATRDALGRWPPWETARGRHAGGPCWTGARREPRWLAWQPGARWAAAAAGGAAQGLSAPAGSQLRRQPGGRAALCVPAEQGTVRSGSETHRQGASPRTRRRAAAGMGAMPASGRQCGSVQVTQQHCGARKQGGS